MADPNDKEFAGEDKRPEHKTPVVKTLRQFLSIARAFFVTSSQRREARGFLVLTLTFALAVGGIQVLMSYTGRDFITAISRKDVGGYWKYMGLYLGTFALAVPVGVYYRWLEERLALLWRESLAEQLIERYFNNRAYYRLRGQESIDNPDQRIAEDVKLFTQKSLTFLLIGLNSTVTLIVFVGVLWTISGTLVLVLVLYAIVGTAGSMLIGRRLVGLHYTQYGKEADLRYGLVRVRDNAESIAFYRGEKREHADLTHRLIGAVRNAIAIIAWNRRLGFFVNGYNYAALIIPTAIAAPLYMRGEIEFGVLTQAGGAFAQVLAAVSLIITQFEALSAYLANVQRLGLLWDNLDDFDAEELRVAEESKRDLDEESRVIRVEKLRVCTPGNEKTLVKDLTFELRRKQSLLVMGPSGTGKSSLLRTVAGLWASGGGSLERPPLSELMFLPQRPYMIEGTLRDQLLYPFPEAKLSDEEIRKVVDQVNLADVFDRVSGDLDAKVDWTNILSIGEQQRIAFARLFLRKPRFVFLDEATSALDEENQNRMYELLEQAGPGFVSVGHRLSLVGFHERVLELESDGSWKITDAKEMSAWLDGRALVRSGNAEAAIS